MFVKAQIASFIASVIDFFLMILFVEIIGMWYALASVMGNVGGAVSHFIIGRFWVFDAYKNPSSPQIIKYAIVWLGYVTLTFLLLILLKEVINLNYQLAKICVAIGMSFTYNYWLQKKFVFK